MSNFIRRVPDGDDHERLVCADCGHIDYQNPKVVVGSVATHGGRVLLCRRAIEPRRGFWTLPAGYMEMGETVAEGAAREAREEAGAAITIDGILAVFSISRLGQVQVIFRAGLAEQPGAPLIQAGTESLEVGLFAWADIPWDEIAFPSVRWALDAWHALGDGPLGAPAGNPPADRRGAAPLPGAPDQAGHDDQHRGEA